MDDSRNHRFDDGSMVNWQRKAEFHFVDEVDALETLEELASDLAAARRQVEETMRYMSAAVRAAGEVREDGEPISKQAIINHSGLARQTVYDLLK